MSSMVAIDIQPKLLTVVSAQPTTDGRFEIQTIRSIDREAPAANPYQSSESTVASEPSTDQEAIPETTEPPTLSEIVGAEIGTSLAVISSPQLLHETLDLPFRDQKRIDKISPLQIQDLLPFEIGNFVLDNQIMRSLSDEEYRILVSLIPSAEIGSALQHLRSMGGDPKLLTTKPALLASLAQLFPEELSGTFGLLSFTNRQVSLALFIDNQLHHLREISFENPLDGFAHIRSSISRVEHETSQTLSNFYGFGREETLREAELALSCRVRRLDISHFIANANELPVHQEDIAWAVTLFANELVRKKKQGPELVDLRRGQYAYKPTLRNFMAALREELIWIVLCLIFVIGYGAILKYDSSTRLTQIEEAIQSVTRQVMPGDPIPYLQEVSLMEQKISNLEEQLKGVGSLTSLSPLDALKEFSQTISSNVDVELETMTISQTQLSVSGSAKDNIAIGKFDSALKNNKRFCPQSDPDIKGQGTGTPPRVLFSAEIDFCEE